MDEKIFHVLNDIGIPFLSGRDYIECAIKIVAEKGRIPITKELYPEIAIKFHTRSALVERAIRHSIAKASKSKLESVFNKSDLTNREFIYGLAKYLEIYNK
jgi:two-component system response regulator (stage 0 sporulation protein A)